VFQKAAKFSFAKSLLRKEGTQMKAVS